MTEGKRIGAVTLLFCVLFGQGAAAEESGRTDEATAAVRQRAREHFEQGLSLSAEEHWAPALALFEESIRLYPTQVAMFNQALCLRYVDRFPEAIDVFEALLEQFEDEVSASRRAEIETELAQLRELVGRISIELEQEGALVVVDGEEIGRTPLERPLVVTAGRHVVEIQADRFQPLSREVIVGGGGTVTIRPSLEVVQSPGTLTLSTRLHGANVAIDGERVGVTPLTEPLPLSAGGHVVAVTRPGYEPSTRDVEIASGEAAHLEVELRVLEPVPIELAGELGVHVSERDATVLVDGEPIVAGPIPVGPHRVDVELEGFAPWSRLVDVGVARTTWVEATLLPDAGRRARYQRRARSVRIASYVMYGLAAATLGTGLALYLWNDNRHADTWQPERDSIEADYQERDWETGPSDDTLYQRVLASNEMLSEIQRMDYIHGGLFVGGLVCAVIATIMILAGPDQDRYAGVARIGPPLDRLALAGFFGGRP